MNLEYLVAFVQAYTTTSDPSVARRIAKNKDVDLAILVAGNFPCRESRETLAQKVWEAFDDAMGREPRS